MGPAGAAAALDQAAARRPLAGSLAGPQRHLVPGAPGAWRDLPERYGPWETVSKRVARWQTDGTWARIEAALATQADAAGELDWDAQVDSSVVRTHQHAAGPAKGARLDPGKPPASAGAVTGRADHQAPHGLRLSRVKNLRQFWPLDGWPLAGWTGLGGSG
jgi:Putative transposase of IS4/5 family (DUF4096)